MEVQIIHSVESSSGGGGKIELFEAFIDRMNAAAIPYCLLAGHGSYPEDIPSDIDFVVASAQLDWLYPLLGAVAQDCGARLVQALQHETTACYYVLAKCGGESIAFLHPDACSDYCRNGRLLLRSEEILAERIKSIDDTGEAKGFYIPAPAKAFIYYLVKKIDKGDLQPHHGDYLSSLWCQDQAGCRQEVKRFWKKDEVDLIARATSQGDWNTLRDALPQLQVSLRDGISFSWLHWWREMRRKVRRVFSPTGLWVVFLGADGSGKSSVIKGVVEGVSPAFRRTACFHLRPTFLGRRCWRGQAPVTDPHGLPVRGMLASLLKLLFFLCDYGVGYFWKIRSALVRSTLVVFDRYYHDLLVDPKRYCYGGPVWLASLVGKCIPQPDLFILLDAPAEVLQSRKQEVAYAETIRQREAYLQFVRSQKNGVVIDASQPLASVIRDACDNIFDFMAHRTAKRLGHD